MKNFEKIKKAVLKVNPKIKLRVVEKMGQVWILAMDDWDFYRSPEYRAVVAKLRKLITKEKWVTVYQPKDKKI